MNKYLFILGNHSALSQAELFAVSRSFFGDVEFNWRYNETDSIAVLEIAKKFEMEFFQNMVAQIGGVIKIGEILREGDNLKSLESEIVEVIPKKNGEKVYYGFSVYGRRRYELKQLGMTIKRELGERDLKCRWVTSKEAALSSVVVEQNYLLERGADIIIYDIGGRVYLGRALAVQPFKDLSFRDYGRPGRDDKSGMLPPKLAQIMINLASFKLTAKTINNATILDPFCGSGTVLSEAALMGFKNLSGSDLSEKAVADSIENMKWTEKTYGLENINCKIQVKSAIEVAAVIAEDSIDMIITEPFLGPQRGVLDVEKVSKELETLYEKAMKQFEKVLKKDGVIVMLWPVFRRNGRSEFINPNIGRLKIFNPALELVKDSRQLSFRETFIYGREEQRVWREVVILVK